MITLMNAISSKTIATPQAIVEAPTVNGDADAPGEPETPQAVQAVAEKPAAPPARSTSNDDTHPFLVGDEVDVWWYKLKRWEHATVIGTGAEKATIGNRRKPSHHGANGASALHVRRPRAHASA